MVYAIEDCVEWVSFHLSLSDSPEFSFPPIHPHGLIVSRSLIAKRARYQTTSYVTLLEGKNKQFTSIKRQLDDHQVLWYLGKRPIAWLSQDNKSINTFENNQVWV